MRNPAGVGARTIETRRTIRRAWRGKQEGQKNGRISGSSSLIGEERAPFAHPRGSVDERLAALVHPRDSIDERPASFAHPRPSVDERSASFA
jgi:hypothetical protein